MRREQIRGALEAATGQGPFRARELRDQLKSVDEVELFFGLFPIAAAAQWNGPTTLAAHLLLDLEPTCPVPCEEAIRMMLPDWDVSIEEVPCYLVTQFGKLHLRSVLLAMRSELPDGLERVRLETIYVWSRSPTVALMGGYFVRKNWEAKTRFDEKVRALE